MSKVPAVRPDPRVPVEDRAGTLSTAVELRLGAHVRVATRLDVTPAALLAIGGMVSMILLSSAAIVRAAHRRRS